MIDIKANTCDYCGTCVAVCHLDCIELLESSIDVDNNVCDDCCKCVYVCPLEVLSADILEKANAVSGE